MTEERIAVLDRIVDGETAVLLVEGDEQVVDQFDIPISDIPSDGRTEGAVFEITYEGEEIHELQYVPEEAEKRKEELQDRFDRLSNRLGDSDDED